MYFPIGNMYFYTVSAGTVKLTCTVGSRVFQEPFLKALFVNSDGIQLLIAVNPSLLTFVTLIRCRSGCNS